jgi:hypothetical protein
LADHLGEVLPELGSPFVIDVVVAGWLVLAQFPDHVCLLPLQFFDLAAERGGAGGCAVIDGGLGVGVGGGEEERVSVRAEDAPGEEGVDQVQEFVFADPEALGVGGVPVLAGVVGGYRFAGVVAVSAGGAAGFAVEPASAQVADDVRAEPVGAGGGGMGVGPVAGA